MGLTITAVAALILLLSGEISLALNIAVFALVVLYFLHSFALLVLPWRNRELFDSITVHIPLWLQRVSAVISILAMGGIIALQLTSIATIELAAVWTFAGALVYFVAHRGTSRRIEDTEKPKLA